MKKKFFPEQIQLLKENQFTEYVSNSTIRFSREFKNLFWQEYQKGKTPRQIFSSFGFDPEILGDSRMSNFAYNISQAHTPAALQKESDRLKALEAQVDALQFQMDTLKKYCYWRIRESQRSPHE